MGNSFTCAACGKTFESEWTDEEAEEELQDLWGGVRPEDCVVICDDCFHKNDDACLDAALREHRELGYPRSNEEIEKRRAQRKGEAR